MDTMSWTDRAACRGMNVEAFYAEVPTLEALGACLRCPVRRECDEFAMSNGEAYGMWGARTAEQRVNRGMFVEIERRDWVVDLRRHGTPAGPRWHYRNKIPMCKACRDVEVDLNAIKEKDRIYA